MQTASRNPESWDTIMEVICVWAQRSVKEARGQRAARRRTREKERTGLEPCDGLNIEMVGGLIEEEEVNFHEHGSAEGDAGERRNASGPEERATQRGTRTNRIFHPPESELMATSWRSCSKPSSRRVARISTSSH